MRTYPGRPPANHVRRYPSHHHHGFARGGRADRAGPRRRRLAACVQVLGPITSTYRWEGAIETSQEWRCEAKTRVELYDEIEKAIRSLHSYQVPEILAVPVVDGSADYLAWLDREVKQPAEE